MNDRMQEAQRGITWGTAARLRSWIGEGYFHATFAGRRWYARRLAAAGRAPLAVLTFHRVADECDNPWTTCTAHFVAAVRWLKAHFDLVSLDEVQRRMRVEINTRPAVHICFDDGYADNCRVALPLLIDEGIPFTYFVTTGPVLHRQPFAHDARRGRCPPSNTIEQLRDLAQAGAEIGAHTRTHADMGRIRDPAQLADELVTARDELAAALGRPVRYFAFPFGMPQNLSLAAFRLARAAGYEGVCSSYGGWNYAGRDSFHILRRMVDGPPNRVKNWALIDPLREWFVPHFTLPATPESNPMGAPHGQPACR